MSSSVARLRVHSDDHVMKRQRAEARRDATPNELPITWPRAGQAPGSDSRLEEPATADEVRGDEAVPAPAATLQTLRDRSCSTTLRRHPP